MNEIPDKVFVPLGRRGFDPVSVKRCHICNKTSVMLTLLEKEDSEKQEGNTILEEIDYKIKCDSCNGIFYIRIQTLFDMVDEKKRRITSKVNILNDKKEDLGWLGAF